MIALSSCARLQGHSVVICRCKTADGFLPCPDEALRVSTPTFPPVAYQRAREVLALEAKPVPPGGQRQVAERPTFKVYTGGYTGSICDVCGSARMRRSGTCETCEECGNAGGCG